MATGAAGLEQVAEYGGEGLARGEAGAAGGVLAGAADGELAQLVVVANASLVSYSTVMSRRDINAPSSFSTGPLKFQCTEIALGPT